MTKQPIHKDPAAQKRVLETLSAIITHWSQPLALHVLKSCRQWNLKENDLDQAITDAIETLPFITWNDILARTKAYQRGIKHSDK